MSEELQDEVEAINSIYGDGSLTAQAAAAAEMYVLSLPDETTVSLRLHFPPEYPSVPPSVLGTHSSGGKQRGVGDRDLALFRAALGNVFQPGQVCLFDAIEEMRTLRGEEAAGVDDEPDRLLQDEIEADGVGVDGDGDDDDGGGLGDEPPWVISDPITEMKSTFVARCAPVKSTDQASGYVQHLLATNKKVRTAHHNITAWRIRGPNGTAFQDCDDDGETAAGGRILHIMQLMDLWDVMVVVTRWYGGQKLGPRRFAVINSAARDAFVKAGLVDAPAKKKGHGK